MANVGKSTDGMLDEILRLQRNRDETKVLLDLYMEGGLLAPQVASHLWEVLNGLRPGKGGIADAVDRDTADQVA